MGARDSRCLTLFTADLTTVDVLLCLLFKMIFLSVMSELLFRTKPVPRGPSLYYEEPKKPKKVITWNEAMDARPPLRIDMEGPGPTQYSPRNRPLNETNSPAWTFGSKCFTEKSR